MPSLLSLRTPSASAVVQTGAVCETEMLIAFERLDEWAEVVGRIAVVVRKETDVLAAGEIQIGGTSLRRSVRKVLAKS